MEINPYHVPESSEPETAPCRSRSKTKTYPFASARVRAVATMFMLGCCVLTSAASIVANGILLRLLECIQARESIASEAVKSVDFVADLSTISCMVAAILSEIVFLFWIHRAHRNLPSLGAGRLEYSPGWAVAAWFIPFMNLIWPYQAVAEIWKASDPASVGDQPWRWRNNPTGSLLPCWWATYLFMTIGSAVMRRIEAGSKTLDGQIFSVNGILLLRVLTIVAALLAIAVVWKIDRRQQAAHEAVLQRGEGEWGDAADPVD